ncbi:MAG TPA: hypothetical protein VFU73_02145 [Actinocrinis sp.]|nr:hypothetical protein [Actinocrinis sp.]
MSESARDRPGGVLADIKDAVTVRSALLVIAVLGLGVGFILSYVGALHQPEAKDLPFAVVAPAEIQGPVLIGFNSLPGQPLSPRLAADPRTARAQVADRGTMGALVVDAASTTDTLYVASAAGPSISTTISRIVVAADGQRGRSVRVVDLVPVSPRDSGGLTSFYMAIGWTVAGYLIASILGISSGSRPATFTRATIRLIALALCAFAAGIVGTWLVQYILGALPGPYWPTVAVGTLLVFGAGAVTVLLQIGFGIVGIGLAVLLFVILGNPSAGGAYARALIPPFWRAIGAFLPPGAGTDATRSIAYFGGQDTAQPLLILGGYALVGLVGALLLAVFLRPKGRTPASAAPPPAPSPPTPPTVSAG